jgi:hypothetical protein
MGAGRHAGRADEADHLALAHRDAGLDARAEAGHVAVAGADLARMLELHEDPVAAVVARHHHFAGAGCENGRAARRAEIDTGMHGAVAQDGMLAQAEARGHLGRIHWRAQEGAHDAFALGIVELVGAVLRAEADHRDEALAEMELAGEQASRMGDLAVAGDELLQQYGELHAFLQLALEVDVVAERADELDHGLRWRAAGHAARLERAVPLALDPHDARADPVGLLFAGVAAIVLAFDDVLALGLRPDRERQHARRVGLARHGLDLELDLLADGDPALFQDRLQRLIDRLAIGLRHVDIGQHLVDRVALLQAQGELVAVGGRRLWLVLLRGLLSDRLGALEALEIRGRQAPELLAGDRRHGIRLGQGGFGQDDGGRGWRGATAMEEEQRAEAEANGADTKQNRPEQHEQRRFGAVGPARRRRGIRHDR